MSDTMQSNLFWQTTFQPVEPQKAPKEANQGSLTLIVRDARTDKTVLNALQEFPTGPVAMTVEEAMRMTHRDMQTYDQIVCCLGHVCLHRDEDTGELVKRLMTPLEQLFSLTKHVINRVCPRKGMTIRFVIYETASDSVTAGYPFWAFTRAAHVEQTYTKELRLQCVKLLDFEQPSLEALAGLMSMPPSLEMPLVRVRSGELSIPVIGKYSSKGPAQQPQVEFEGAFIVSGGRTGLGWKTVQMLFRRGASHILILSSADRSRLSDEQKQFVDSVQKDGKTVFYPNPVDICSVAQVNTCVEEFVKKFPDVPILGVFHSAAQFKEKSILALTESDISSSLETKMKGTLNLYNAVRHLNTVNSFVVYSTIACVVGNATQSAYVVANAAAETLVQLLHSKEMRMQAIQWSALDIGTVIDRKLAPVLKARGMTVLDDADIELGFDTCLHTEEKEIIVARFDQDLSRKSVLSPNAGLRTLLAGAFPDASRHDNGGDTYTRQEIFDRVSDLMRLHPPAATGDDLLMLYGLFKQATTGNCLSPDPGCSDISTAADRLKAWKSQMGKTKKQAQLEYIEFAKNKLGRQWPLISNSETVDVGREEPFSKRARS